MKFRMKCTQCNKKLLIEYSCKCKKVLCITHLYSDMHNCTFDYKSDEKKRLEYTMELIVAPKIKKI